MQMQSGTIACRPTIIAELALSFPEYDRSSFMPDNAMTLHGPIRACSGTEKSWFTAPEGIPHRGNDKPVSGMI